MVCVVVVVVVDQESLPSSEQVDEAEHFLGPVPPFDQRESIKIRFAVAVRLMSCPFVSTVPWTLGPAAVTIDGADHTRPSNIPIEHRDCHTTREKTIRHHLEHE